MYHFDDDPSEFFSAECATILDQLTKALYDEELFEEALKT
jgi:hypothetical protein